MAPDVKELLPVVLVREGGAQENNPRLEGRSNDLGLKRWVRSHLDMQERCTDKAKRPLPPGRARAKRSAVNSRASLSGDLSPEGDVKVAMRGQAGEMRELDIAQSSQL